MKKKRSVKSPVKASSRKKPGRTSPGAGPKSFDRLLQTGGTVTEDLRLLRFAGVSLGGGKTDKTAVSVIEYYPDKRRVFLRSLHEKISGKIGQSADDAFLQIIRAEERDLALIAFDAPTQMPKCLRCQLRCPGVEKCTEPEIKWMRQMHAKREKSKRPNKMFTPYTERAAEIYISHELEEPFHPSHALGANAAPLAARAHFLKRLLLPKIIEVYPKLSLWRIGISLDVPKSYLRFHSHSVDGDEARHFFLKTLIEREIAFIYQQDLRIMVENNVAFEAFLAALTAFLKHRGQTEKRPADFPKEELWIDFPAQKIRWF